MFSDCSHVLGTYGQVDAGPLAVPSCDNPLASAAPSLVGGDRAAACMKVSEHQARSQRCR